MVFSARRPINGPDEFRFLIGGTKRENKMSTTESGSGFATDPSTILAQQELRVADALARAERASQQAELAARQAVQTAYRSSSSLSHPATSREYKPRLPSVELRIPMTAKKALIIGVLGLVALYSLATPVRARISHYWPPYGGTNCATFVDNQCISATRSGEPWKNWTDRGAACQLEDLGDYYLVEGRFWKCVDTGGGIVRNSDGTRWIDLMTKHPPVPYGTDVWAIKFNTKW